MSGRITIAVYKPMEGKEKELESLVRMHHERLKKEDLVTERLPIIGKAKDNSIMEVFEWKSETAIQSAHSNPNVLAMWEEFGNVCTYIPMCELSESRQLFSDFTPLKLNE